MRQGYPVCFRPRCADAAIAPARARAVLSGPSATLAGPEDLRTRFLRHSIRNLAHAVLVVYPDGEASMPVDLARGAAAFASAPP